MNTPISSKRILSLIESESKVKITLMFKDKSQGTKIGYVFDYVKRDIYFKDMQGKEFYFRNIRLAYHISNIEVLTNE